MYYIGTETRYLAIDKNGGMYAAEDISKAKLYETSKRASKALVALPKRFYQISSKWSVREYIKPSCAKTLPDIIQPSETGNETENLKNELTAVSDCEDYITLLDSIANLKENKANCIARLYNRLSDIDLEIIDIEHYIEFSKFNAAAAYYAYKMLRDKLQERRKIKDSIAAAQALYDNCNVEKIASCSYHLHNREYKPRRLTELF